MYIIHTITHTDNAISILFHNHKREKAMNIYVQSLTSKTLTINCLKCQMFKCWICKSDKEFFIASVFQLSELLFIFKRNLSFPLSTWNCNCSVDLCSSLNKTCILYDSGIKTKNAKLLLCHNSKLFCFLVFYRFVMLSKKLHFE